MLFDSALKILKNIQFIKIWEEKDLPLHSAQKILNDS